MGIALKQTWMMCGAFLNVLSCGFHGGYTPILFRDLKAPGSDIQLSLEAESWVVSAIAISSLASVVLVAPTLQIMGRKLAHITVVLPNCIACLILYFAKDLKTLLIARLFSGLTLGSALFVTAVIVGEYSSPQYRGIFLNLKAASVTIGIFLVHLVGIFFDWRTTALIGLVPSAMALLNTLTWTESPAWLAYKGKYEDCKESFEWLRGNSHKANEELALLIHTQKSRQACKIKNNSRISSLKEILSKFARKDFQKPSLVVFFVFVILETCGRHTFSSYAVKFMSAFTNNSASTLYYVLAVDVIVCISSLCSCGIVKLFRRRTILFTSGGLACCVMMSICVYLYLKSRGITPEGNVWFPVAILILYFTIINAGVATIAISVLGEIYPLEHKGLGTVVSGIFFSLSMLIALKVTPALIRTIDVYGTFFVYDICMIASLVYLYFFLPETEGKTLQEIEHNFNGISLIMQNESEDKLLNTR